MDFLLWLLPSNFEPAQNYILDHEEQFGPKRRRGEFKISLLRSPLLARYHQDPRWQRLMRTAGFDPGQVR